MQNLRRAYASKSGIAIASASTLMLTACSVGETVEDSSSSGQLRVMGYAGVVEQHYTEAVIEPFMEEYPDIEVEYVPSASSAEMLGTLRSEQNSPNTDVAFLDISIANTGNEEGIFQELDPEKVPNSENIEDSDSEIDGDFGPPVTFDNLVLLYNKEKISEEPTSWEALWSDEAAGEIIIDGAPDLQGMSLMLILNDIEGADYKDTVDPGIARLAEIAPDVQSWEPTPDAYTMINNGTGAIGVGWNARAQFYADEPDSNLGVAIPEEGSVFQTNSINLVAGTEYPEAAQTFINYALSPEAQQSFSETMYYAPANSEAELDNAVTARTATTPERLESIIDIDWNYVAEQNDAWTEVWRRDIIGG
ncbi:putative spermidine/putrescine transport system substrate-binding protein [Spinactinospora alkalitolerans]|uniref:Putative spermidine/putrescine transport system substrate-binding protein n=1 Tax=Spinactinospora alkalitolerans TaxID=687207 RepID=A0A852U1U2_9ACTN|nr:ABC transporter substrate-binding protein [Spinactinospora alkalitolerans]NYE50091.1 putative spermidine/putrescine transport system substrate-binding protein [Spinactinospora alkalitolerans]